MADDKSNEWDVKKILQRQIEVMRERNHELAAEGENPDDNGEMLENALEIQAFKRTIESEGDNE